MSLLSFGRLEVKVANCQHKEQIESTPALPGIEVGTCSYCGQRVQYNSVKRGDMPVVLRLGRIGGKPVLPNPVYGLSLNPQDKDDLAVATGKDELIEAGAPPKPKKGKGYLRKVQEYYEQHKEAIISDYYLMSRVKFFSKWDLSSTVWMKLQKRWKVALKGPVHRFTGAPIKTSKPPSESTDKGAPKVTTGDNGALPPFPAFNEGWSSIVKVEWLKTYRELKAPLKGDR